MLDEEMEVSPAEINAVAREMAEETIKTFNIGGRDVTLQKQDGSVSACIEGTCHEIQGNDNLFDVMVSFLGSLINPEQKQILNISQEISGPEE